MRRARANGLREGVIPSAIVDTPASSSRLAIGPESAECDDTLDDLGSQSLRQAKQHHFCTADVEVVDDVDQLHRGTQPPWCSEVYHPASKPCAAWRLWRSDRDRPRAGSLNCSAVHCDLRMLPPSEESNRWSENRGAGHTPRFVALCLETGCASVARSPCALRDRSRATRRIAELTGKQLGSAAYHPPTLYSPKSA